MANISYHRRLHISSSSLDSEAPHHLLDPYHPFLYSISDTESPFPSNSNPRSIDLQHPAILDAFDEIDSDHEPVLLNSTTLDPLDRQFSSGSLPGNFPPTSPFVTTPPCSESDDASELEFGFMEDDSGQLENGVGLSSASNEDVDVSFHEDAYFIQRRRNPLDAESSISSVPPYPLSLDLGFGLESEMGNAEPTLATISTIDGYANEIESYNCFEDDEASVDLPFRWDSLHIDDNEDDYEVVVDGQELVTDSEAEENGNEDISLSLMTPFIVSDDLVSIEVARNLTSESPAISNVAWEVLLNADNQFSGNHSDYVYTAEYDNIFGQLLESESFTMGSHPPAARLVVESLDEVVVSRDDVARGSLVCAVCKDEVNVGEVVNELPCGHKYHRECVLPWLAIRNTCPVCRHELPTDDVDYERRKAAMVRH